MTDADDVFDVIQAETAYNELKRTQEEMKGFRTHLDAEYNKQLLLLKKPFCEFYEQLLSVEHENLAAEAIEWARKKLDALEKVRKERKKINIKQ